MCTDVVEGHAKRVCGKTESRSQRPHCGCDGIEVPCFPLLIVQAQSPIEMDELLAKYEITDVP